MYRMALMALIAGDVPGLNRERLGTLFEIRRPLISRLGPQDFLALTWSIVLQVATVVNLGLLAA